MISLWEKRARQLLPAATRKPKPILLDSLPDFLTALTQSIEDGTPHREAMREIAQGHAKQRITLKDYSLEQIHAEYTLLRQIIFQFLDKETGVQALERDIILDFLAEAARAAMAEYTHLVQQASKLSEERLAIALDTAAMGTFDWNIPKREVVWSDTMARLFGFSPGNAPTSIDEIWEHVHPDDVAAFDTDFARSSERQRDYRNEYRVLWPDRRIHWISALGRTYFNSDGIPVRMIGTAFDITARKEAEITLRESEAKLRILYQSDLMGVVFGDVGGRIYDANDHFLQLLGYTLTEVTSGNFSWINITPPEYRHLDVKAISELKQMGRCRPYEKPLIRKDGSEIWLMVSAVFTDATHFNYVAIVIDVTDRKRAQEALERSERKLRLVNESIPQAIWTAEPDGTVLEYNRIWFSYTGLPIEKGRGRGWIEVIHPDDRPKNIDIWEHSLKTGEPFTYEHRIRRHDGVYRWFLSRAIPIRDKSGAITKWFGTSTDIDDMKRAQHALEQERELREQFVNTLSHDLRNPLSAARTSAQLIARFPKDMDRILMLSNLITDHLNRANRMIEDLLDANRIRAGQGIPIEPEICDVVRIVKTVQDEVNSIYGERVRIQTPLSIQAYWSAKNIQRLLENLVINAIKYGSKQTPVQVTVTDLDQQVEISVHNFGNPIPSHEQPYLFDPFIRSKEASRKSKSGWGLGLTLVRGVTEAHGGHVSVTSTEAEGTTFTVTLPKNAQARGHKAAA
ncbi:MAG: PAS domain-containing protein [Bdellovibrionia bacterium]